MCAFALGTYEGQRNKIEVKDGMVVTFNQDLILKMQVSEKYAYTVEVCCGCYEDCLAAYHGGAKRVELNSALSVGGLTPSLATLIQVKKTCDLKVICMVRPRSAGFCYCESEKDIMLEDARILLEHGADGIAFGFLHEDASIHQEYSKAMVELIHSYGKEAVFHRAFDIVKDPYQAIEILIELKVDRILTSGQKAKAMDGIELIKELQAKYGMQIELLAGSGMNESNAKTMIEYTKIQQIHSSCKAYLQDPTTQNEFVSYAYIDSSNLYDVVSVEKVRKLIASINNV